jgi:hypothetical protein
MFFIVTVTLPEAGGDVVAGVELEELEAGAGAALGVELDFLLEPQAAIASARIGTTRTERRFMWACSCSTDDSGSG